MMKIYRKSLKYICSERHNYTHIAAALFVLPAIIFGVRSFFLMRIICGVLVVFVSFVIIWKIFVSPWCIFVRFLLLALVSLPVLHLSRFPAFKSPYMHAICTKLEEKLYYFKNSQNRKANPQTNGSPYIRRKLCRLQKKKK